MIINMVSKNCKPNCHEQTYSIKLSNTHLDFTVSFHNASVSLAEIVPLARQLSHEIFVNQRIDLPPKDQMPCKQGCCATCCHNIIMLSVPEAIRIAHEIQSLPKECSGMLIRSCMHTSEIAKRYLHQNKIITQNQNLMSCEKKDLQQIHSLFGQMNLKCPFLVNNTCSIYDFRPFICRGWYIKGPVSQCEKKQIFSDNVLHPPLHIENVLIRLTSELTDNQYGKEAVALFGIFDWLEGNQHRTQHTWPADFIIDTFFNCIQEELQWQQSHRGSQQHTKPDFTE